jgi:hypothetical protein
VSLEAVVAVPFRDAGTDRVGEGAFVVALSLDRDWFSPDQAKRVVDVAAGRGLIERDGNDVIAGFNPGDVRVPDDFSPDESVLREQSAFEQILDLAVTAGLEKQAAVAAINDRQRELGVTLEAAAVLYARRHGVDVSEVAARVAADLRAPKED